MSASGWIGVDLDGTLAHYDQWRGVEHIGAPVPAMVARVRQWLAEGKEVRIFTARMHGHGVPDLLGGPLVDVVRPIEKWCMEHLGQVLPVTNVKDFGMIELWDDRCVQVGANTGEPVGRDEELPDALADAFNKQDLEVLRRAADQLEAEAQTWKDGWAVSTEDGYKWDQSDEFARDFEVRAMKLANSARFLRQMREKLLRRVQRRESDSEWHKSQNPN